MAIPLYLAMTAAEITACSHLPRHIGYMSCHFSPCGQGLSNLPDVLPPRSLLVLDDRMPIQGHRQDLIVSQLLETISRTRPRALLLDFQRQGCREAMALAQALLSRLPCPVGVSEAYGSKLDCPLFLPPVPPHQPLRMYLAPYVGREVWLEAAISATEITLRQDGSVVTPLSEAPNPPGTHRDPRLFCHYTIRAGQVQAVFTLQRTVDDLSDLLQAAPALGVTMAVGLYQELGKWLAVLPSVPPASEE